MKAARTPRVWIEQTLNAVTSNNTDPIELPKRTAHHLTTVLRASDGQAIELFNGDGNNYAARIECVGKKVFATIENTTPNPSESALSTLLVQAISRGDRMDTSIQKCVELGITRIQPVYSRHSIPVLKGDRSEKKREHWQAIAISAAEQSGRSVVPTVLPAQNLSDWLQSPWSEEKTNGMVGWVLDPTAEKRLNASTESAQPSRHALLIGPETGLDTPEISAATDSGFIPIQFGPRILRTETAGPAVLSALQTLAGDLLT